MVGVLASSTVDVGTSLSGVKPNTIKLVFVATQLIMHRVVRAKTGYWIY